MNKIYRTVWSEKLNSWIAVAENVSVKGKKNKSTKLLLTGLMSMSLMPHALAFDECGPAVSGDSVTCTGSVSGDIYYYNKNISLTLNGNTVNGPVNINGLYSTNNSWITPVDDFDLSVTSQGPVSISNSNNDYLIIMDKSKGNGDILLSLGGETSLTQTGGVSGSYSPAAISISNYGYNAEKINTIINIDNGAHIVVDQEAYGVTGIMANHYGDGEFKLVNNGSIEVSAGNSTYGSYGSAYGISVGAYAISATIENNGKIVLKNKGSGQNFGSGISLNTAAYDYTKPFSSSIKHTGTIEGDAQKDGDQYYGIDVYFTGSEEESRFQLDSSGDITGVNYGIFTLVNGEKTQGNIHQDGGIIEAEQVGIWLAGLESEATVQTSGKISTGKNTDTKGIYITSSSGGLLALGRVIQDAGGDIYDQGIDGDTAGIYVENTRAVDISVSGKVRSNRMNGVYLQEADREYIALGSSGSLPIVTLEDGQSTFKVDVQSGGLISGGSSGAGINTIGGNNTDITIHSGGTVEALSDLVVKTNGYNTEPYMGWEYVGGLTWVEVELVPSVWLTPGPIILNNAGTMTGVVQLGGEKNTLVNETSGVWNLRNFSDKDHDQVRDTLAVAISEFVSGSDNSVENKGTINLLNDESLASSLDASNAYDTGYIANAMSLGGAAQAQILGVQSFNNSGVINLTSDDHTVGNVLLISGGHTPGISGGGVYVADGGQLKINTVLNEGGDNTQSDMLIVDSTRLGRGTTSVLVNNVGGAGARTVDNGIEVVRVIESANSAAGVFKLGARTTAGLYEYDLYQGGAGSSAADGNWYLRSLALPATPVINPESTVYLRNLNAASTMFMHTLHDRLGEPQFTDPYKTDDNNPSSAWVRVVSNHTDSVGGNGQVDLNTDTNLVHLGTDIARWSSDGNDRWLFGVMGAYGQSKIDASAKYFAVTPSGFERNATGKVDGYSVGAYATWYGNKDKPEGAYVDTWAQYGWYDNKVQGNTKAEERYNSSGWTASVEAGYAMVARAESKDRQWIFEPQVQVAYNNYSSNDHTDASGTRITDDNANGVITRVGARLYGRSTQNDNGIQPFVEANWWYSDAKNSLSFNGQTMEDGTPDSRYEMKVGLQGQVAKDWLIWGHAGVQYGSNDFNRYEGMVGIKRVF